MDLPHGKLKMENRLNNSTNRANYTENIKKHSCFLVARNELTMTDSKNLSLLISFGAYAYSPTHCQWNQALQWKSSLFQLLRCSPQG